MNLIKDKDTGYFIWSDQVFVSQEIEREPKKLTFNTDRLFLNCGGTIVSGPTKAFTGVEPLKDLLSQDSKLEDFLKKQSISYDVGILKLSEHWTYQDYITIKNQMLSSGKKKFILTYGTDFISFFAPWIALLSEEFSLKCVILIAQRSLDRPTSEFYKLLSFSLKILDKAKSKSCYVLTYHPKGIWVHNPYTLKKYHTTAKEGFYSKDQKLNFLDKSIELSKTFKLYKKTINKPQEIKKPSIIFETPFIDLGAYDIRVSRGVGNPKVPTDKLFTTVSKGPLNRYLYQVNALIKEDHLTWEAQYTIDSMTL